MEISNPLALRSSLQFAGILALVFLFASVAGSLLGDAAVLTTAAVGGAASLHAVSLAISTLAAGGDLSIELAILAILIGFLANMAVKLVLVAWAGGPRLFFRVAPPLLVMIGAAVGAYYGLVR
jgi:uncharacterized membrane protein (DUF4010 family)